MSSGTVVVTLRLWLTRRSSTSRTIGTCGTSSKLVLDWQHPSYWFRPHAVADATRWPPSPVTPFPDGDYYIFLTEDMSQGTFGHPWEQTLCVFGNDLVDDLVPTLPFPIRRRQPRIVSMTSGERSGADAETE